MQTSERQECEHILSGQAPRQPARKGGSKATAPPRAGAKCTKAKVAIPRAKPHMAIKADAEPEKAKGRWQSQRKTLDNAKAGPKPVTKLRHASSAGSNCLHRCARGKSALSKQSPQCPDRQELQGDLQ